MTKLNQIVAVEKGIKSKSHRELTDIYREVGKTPLLSGISRTYQPKDDDGDQLPAESTLVQTNVEDLLENAATALIDLFDVTYTKETANQTAKADVVVDGKTIVKDAPVTYLLFLEKQLIELNTLVSKLPVLDPSERWNKDTNANAWATEPTRTVRTKKVPRNHVKAEATDRHPAQVELFHEDVIVGTWTTVKYSGAIEKSRANELLERVDKLSTAVKFAREEANSATITDKKTGDKVFDYLFAK